MFSQSHELKILTPKAFQSKVRGRTLGTDSDSSKLIAGTDLANQHGPVYPPHVFDETLGLPTDASANDSSLSQMTTFVAVTPVCANSFGHTSRSKYVAMFSDVGLYGST